MKRKLLLPMFLLVSMSVVSDNFIENGNLDFHVIIDQSTLIEQVYKKGGVKLYADYDSSIRSIGDGEVVYVGDLSEYKNLVIIKHNRQVLSTYSDLGQALVIEGQIIQKGQELGRSSDFPVSVSVRVSGYLLSGEQLREFVTSQ